VRVSRPAAVVFVWALAALAGGILCTRAAAQIITTPTTEATSASTRDLRGSRCIRRTNGWRPAAPRPTAAASGPPTTPPTTVPTTVAGTLPPTTAGPAPALSTIPVEDTRPGEGKMPAWPLVLSGVGFAGAGAILGWHWMQTRPR